MEISKSVFIVFVKMKTQEIADKPEIIDNPGNHRQSDSKAFFVAAPADRRRRRMGAAFKCRFIRNVYIPSTAFRT